MEKVTVTVEHDFSDTCSDGFLSDSLANLGCNFTLSALFDAL